MTYTAHKPVRKNSRKLIVTDENGKEYIVNRHGVVISWKPDPHFPGMAIMDWLTQEEETAILDAVIAQQPQFTGCKCCYSRLPRS